MGMADITIDTLVNARTARAPRKDVMVTTLIGYTFYVDADAALVYKKTTDGGATWGAIVTVQAAASDIVMAFDIWFDKWTPGGTGTRIHVAYFTDNSDDIYYDRLDTAGDTLLGQTLIVAATSAVSAYGSSITIAKARGGNLVCAFNIDGGTETGTYKSGDAGLNWASTGNMAEASADLMIMYPGNEADNQDMWMLYLDTSANELTLKVLDDSAGTVSESAAIATVIEYAVDYRAQHQFGGSIRPSDGHLIAAVFTDRDTATTDFRVFDINGTASIVEKTALATDKDDCYFAYVYINDAGAIYVAYLGKLDGSETQETNWFAYYAVSTDGGATWNSNNPYSATGSDWEQAWCPLNGPRFMITWRDFSSNALLTNVDNAVNRGAPTVASCSPDSGPEAGGTAITITGTNLMGVLTVTIDGQDATSVVAVNDTTITCVTPAGTAGAVDVVVETSSGTGTGSGAFTYDAPAAASGGRRGGFFSFGNFGFR